VTSRQKPVGSSHTPPRRGGFGTGRSDLCIRRIGETLDLVKGSNRPLLFVLNNASARAKLTGQASRILSRYGPVAKVVVCSRQDYRSAMIDGRAAFEVKSNSLAAKEIADLWTDVASRLKEGAKIRGKVTR
jgi:chromosome partitioning protein